MRMITRSSAFLINNYCLSSNKGTYWVYQHNRVYKIIVILQIAIVT
jgi:hypothetical protein